MNLLAALGVLTDELHMVAHTIDGEVASLGKRLEDVDLLVANGEHARMVDLADHGDFVVRHAHGDNRVLLCVHEALDLVVDELLTHGFRQTADLQGADHGEVDATLVIHQIGLKNPATIVRDGACRIQRIADEEVKRRRGIGVDGADRYRQNVLRHDAGIVEVLRLLIVDIVAVLDVSDVLGGAAGGQEYCDCSENGIE